MSARDERFKPEIGEYVTIYNPEPTEGYVTELLAVQFVYRETLDGLPQYCFYDDYRIQKKRELRA